MMIGSANVNSLALYYQAATAAILGLFVLYDIRFHKVKNLALLWFLPWCFFSLPVYAHTARFLMELFLLKAVLGFLNGGLILFMAALATNGGIGGGDIKLGALLGFICGTAGICFLLCAAAAAAFVFLLLRRTICGSGNGKLPFVPFLFAGMLLLLLL